LTDFLIKNMGISLKPQHLNRYRQIGWLLAKYGRSDLVKETGLEERDGKVPRQTSASRNGSGLEREQFRIALTTAAISSGIGIPADATCAGSACQGKVVLTS
jgi:hypothetical protein